ncbi:hypothetical protein N0V93_009399 [Gnomoniopsis smithogilvyi]|uniref:CFEM domain-containing protein n=1 Tax=Gnomoniopsis smithogilvyi TaxID=1191159 RepID=A0A9W9CTN3_9PEZI|nr:hypothetical protein N0V93_009399 [Gnomoniopsis smithogilvyi]
MKSAFFIAAASAGLVAAQNLTGEPDCAVPCLSTAIAAVCTPASDQGCACASQGAIGQSALTCLLSNCNGTELGQAQSAGAQLCVDYSATATGVASTSASSSNATTPMTTGTTTGSGATATGATTTSGRTTSGSSSTSSTATGSSASATSSAGANGLNGVVAAQAGLLGALLAGVAAVL